MKYRFCRHEVDHVPESELRFDQHWGWIHEPEGAGPHTIMGSMINETYPLEFPGR